VVFSLSLPLLRKGRCSSESARLARRFELEQLLNSTVLQKAASKVNVDQRRDLLRAVLVDGTVTLGATSKASKKAFRLGQLLGGSRRGGVRQRAARDGSSFGPELGSSG
jgi:hypothetical protein